jgi:hypothetical protein
LHGSQLCQRIIVELEWVKNPTLASDSLMSMKSGRVGFAIGNSTHIALGETHLMNNEIRQDS